MYDFTKILLYWEPISKHGSRGEVLGYRIQYWLSEVQETPVIATVKYEGYIFAPNRTTTLTGLQPFSRYRIRIQAFTEGGYGVWSQEHNGGDVTFTVCYSQWFYILKSKKASTITAKSSWNTHAFLRFSGSFPFLCQQQEWKPPPPVKQC